jgi:hypothetical protein
MQTIREGVDRLHVLNSGPPFGRPFSFQAHSAAISFRGTLPGSVAELSAVFKV